MITFDNFETEIDEKILDRGYKYYKKGKVVELTEIEENIWSALVEGTDVYQLQLEFIENEEIETFCDCPYDQGPYCKHQAALFYTLKERLTGNLESLIKPKKAKKQSQKKLPSISTILDNFSSDKLKEIILYTAETECDIKNYIQTLYLQEKDQPYKNDYIQLIKRNLRSASDRSGFIGYWECGQAMVNLMPIYNEASHSVKSNPYKTVIIAEALIETLVPQMENSDDSNGEIGGVIDAAFDLLQNASDELNENDKEKLFDYCLKECTSAKYSGWSYMWTFLEVAGRVCPISKRESLFNFLDCYLQGDNKDDWKYNYNIKSALDVKWEYLKRQTNIDEAEQFLEDHIDTDNIRINAIEYYLEKNDLPKAKSIAEKGLEKTDYDKDETIYSTYLLNIAHQEDDIDTIKSMTQRLFFSTKSMDYYDKFKSIASKEEWESFFAKVVSNLKRHYIIGEVYVKEKMWKELLEFALKLGITGLEHYESKLKKLYPSEIATAYKKYTYDIIEGEWVGRKKYKKVCQYLRRMKKLGSKEDVEEIIKDLRSKYPRRKALLEELSQV